MDVDRGSLLDAGQHTELVDGKLAVEIGQKVCFDLEQNPKDPGAFVTVWVHLYDFKKSEVEGGRIDDG